MSSKWTHRLTLLLYLWAITFSGATLIFLIETNELITSINNFGLTFAPQLPLLNLSTEKFWLVLTMSLMISLIYICVTAANDIKRRLHFIPILLISKFVSSLFFVIFFLTDTPAIAYLVGAAVDGSIFLFTAYVYLQAKKEIGYRGY